MTDIRGSDCLYVYAIVSGAGPLPQPLLGLCDAPISLHPYRDVAAVVSRMETDEIRGLRRAVQSEHLLRHEHVVETLMAQRPLLPVRFGTAVDGAESLTEVLSGQYLILHGDLRRLAGRVEVGIRVLWDVDSVLAGWTGSEAMASSARRLPGSSPGLRYLLGRARDIDGERFLGEQAHSLAAWCEHELQPVFEGIVVREMATSGMPVSLALLLPRERMPAFVAAAARLQAERPELRFISSGPWPPYHFVTRLPAEPSWQALAAAISEHLATSL
ncbi:MAG: GvpL/GvpF family gas vesicle protein [Anaerolineae bacterium]